MCKSAAFLALCCVPLVLALQGCGTKGPLYLPPSTPPAASPAPTSPAAPSAAPADSTRK